MSIFSEVNRDAVTTTPDQVASGPRVGFLGAFENSYDSQVRASSQFGLEAAFREEEQDIIRKLREKGETPPASLNDNEDGDAFGGFTGGINSSPYMDYARAMVKGDTTAASGLVKDRDEKLAAYKEKYPELGIRTYSEMMDAVRTKAQAAEAKERVTPTTIGGDIGGFIGGAAAGMDVRVNPLNFLTAPIAGAGKTVAARIGAQFGIQGAIETVNQFTGVQENRQILGLEHGVGNALGNIAGAAVGGAALQGIGEGAGALARRWFHNAPGDPAPPMPRLPEAVETPAAGKPLTVPADTARRIEQAVSDTLHMRDPVATSRVGQARARTDLDHATETLMRWDGGDPAFMPPTTATRTWTPAGPARVDLDIKVPGETLDSIARRVDPEVFNIKDKMSADIAAMRAQIADIDTIRAQSREAAAADTTQQQIDVLTAQLDKTKGKAAKQKLQQQIDELEANRPAPVEALPDARATEASLRERLMKADEKLRDIAPAVKRAYDRAAGKWDAYEVQRSQIDEMLRDGADRLPPAKDIGPPPDFDAPRTLAEKVPELNRPDVPSSPGDTAMQTVNKVAAHDAKIADEAIEGYRAQVARMLNPEETELRVDGIDTVLHLDKDRVTVPGPDGQPRNVTIRELLAETDEDNQVLKAVTSCSISRAS